MNHAIAVVLPPGPRALVRINGPHAAEWYESTTSELDGLEYCEIAVDTGLGATQLEIVRPGYVDYSEHVDLAQPAKDQQLRVGLPLDPSRPDDIELPEMEPTSRRPAATLQAELPPYDASTPGEGDVHTSPPPELVVPTSPDPLFMVADFAGCCIDLARWGITIDFQNNWLIGANSTPFNMLMTPMVPMYSRYIQDAVLTTHAEKGYWHFVVAPDGWNMLENGFVFTSASYVAWLRYLQSWGFYTVHWQGDPDSHHPLLLDALDAKVVDLIVLGKEVDAIPGYTSERYHDELREMLALLDERGLNIPVLAHFTANYPKGFPRDTYLTNWADFDGRVHLAWQASQDDSAGKQGAMLYYARERVNLGQVEGDGRPALNSRVYAFETMATNQLYGKSTEEYGNLRSLQLMNCTRRDDRIRPMSGAGNGLRNHDGSPYVNWD